MRTDYLKEFVILADTLSFTEAARRAYITQSALSKHIASMERELGVTLFARDRHHVELTEAGEAMLEDARRAVTCLEGMTRTARRYRQEEAGSLVVGYLRAIAEDAIPLAHRAFRDANPAIVDSYQPYSYNRLIEALAKGVVDVAVGIDAYRDGGVIGDGFDNVELFSDCLCAVASDEHPLGRSGDASVSAKDLANETILVFPSATSFTDRASLVNFFAEQGVEVTFLDRFESLERLPIQLITEDCIALLPSHLEGYFEKSGVGRFSFTPLSGYDSSIVYEMCWRRDSEAACAFTRAFLDVFAPPLTKSVPVAAAVDDMEARDAITA